MLRMKDTCERCATKLGPTDDAVICSYECTFCSACSDAMDAVCPNCGGELVRRPRRTTGAAAIATRTPGRVTRYLQRNRNHP
ncbi:hypothetical protein EV644_12523 [Kribbella orskensis]|uniref:DUF1272 domain-containing protein n=2 Tax=Kribbellaceae TaxID=2726069 RepID=A0ABY2B9N2_9ACTN|nr:hypothetical protein EV642_12768 [Kribbella sp. VKM Ac-2500]TCO12611.1 hypothetical protein EV644_12523 [Kribbella orskensis]